MDELNTQALMAQAEAQGITTWSEEKKKDFVGIFGQRSKCAQYILIKTALIVLERAQSRRFISRKHRDELDPVTVNYLVETSYASGYTAKVGGRDVNDLNKIAEERAEAILKELPPLKQAVQVINTDIAKKIGEREALLKKAKDLKSKLEELNNVISMADVDQKMTVGDFREMVKDRERKRRALALALSEVGEKGCELDTAINKALYEGLPGLSDAVISVVVSYIDRSKALDTVSRRVEERVLFGDSDAALELLKGFEKDELEVEGSIKDEFRAALEKLNVAGKKLRGKK